MKKRQQGLPQSRNLLNKDYQDGSTESRIIAEAAESGGKVPERGTRRCELRARMKWSAGARTEGRTRGERARAHAETRTERRRNVAKEIAAAGAAAVVSDGASGIGAEPVTTRFAQRIDALHGETG
ncbi:MAG TPA: hypothetical protein VKH63_01015 [Candidatus Acidoferrum sp.]|nr:hypothetical protein [Candidatus Acidoferrum sp.]